MDTDEELMARYVAGNREAFRELFRRYAPLLLRLVRAHVDGEEARDLVQQAFLHLHRSRSDFRQGAMLRPWLCTIATNLRREHVRKLRTRRRLGASTEPAEEPVSAPPSEVVDRVRAAIAELPSDQAEVIRLHWMEGLSFQEVSVVVGANLSAVKVRAHRGYEILRRALSAPDPEPMKRPR